MVPNITFRTFMALTVLCLALGISMPPIATPGDAFNFTRFHALDSSGSKVSSIYHGLMPDSRFVNQFGALARRNAEPEDSSYAFRSLTFNRLNSRCDLLAAAFRGPRAVAPRPGSCKWPVYGAAVVRLPRL